MTVTASSAAALARATIEHHSKSFAVASKLLPADQRTDAQVLYAYCRRADDAVDEAPVGEQAARLSALRAELDDVYAGAKLADPLLRAFAEVVQRCAVPREYFEELLAGMEMDVVGVSYHEERTLLRYCYRVAGTVGLMMCHVMGVRDDRALRHAAHLGIAMQLTNIARDVLEDWQRGRLYLPDELLSRHGVADLRSHLGETFPQATRDAVALAVRQLLAQADDYYASGLAGLPLLSLRSAFGVRTAAYVYRAIGARLRELRCDPLAGRAFVTTQHKLWLVLRAGWATLWMAPRMASQRAPRLPHSAIVDPQSLLLSEAR